MTGGMKSKSVCVRAAGAVGEPELALAAVLLKGARPGSFGFSKREAEGGRERLEDASLAAGASGLELPYLLYS